MTGHHPGESTGAIETVFRAEYPRLVAGLTRMTGDIGLAEELAQKVAQRVIIAGGEMVEVRISHLAYSPEIAQAMLRRQQANAVVAARSRIRRGVGRDG